MDSDLKFHLRALTRFIYYVTEEEDRFIVQLKELLVRASRRIFVYNAAFGLMPVDKMIEDWFSRAHQEVSRPDIHEALIQIYKDDPQNEQNFYIMTDPERWLQDPMVVRRILNIAHQLHANEKVVKVMFFVGSRKVIPQKLQPYIEVVEDKGLSNPEIGKVLEKVAGRLQIQPSEALIESFKGLSAYQVDSAISQSIIATKKTTGDNTRRVDAKFVAEYKRRQLSKTDLVTYLDTSQESFERVGGHDRFKEWAAMTKAAWTQEGKKFGLRPPRGVLLLGVWGCGKSISAKALGHTWKVPTVVLDIGKLRQSGVGDSESNTHRATRLIESVAPCIVWVDEAEKSLSGGQSSAKSDAGTTDRMIGILSTWLQETKADVCLALTANSLTNLPPEFVRRCNERFFFDLPSEEDRVDIIKIHLQKNKQDPSKFNLASLAEDSHLMVGSEIEHAILAAMLESFNANKEALDQEILSRELKKRPRIFRTLGHEIKALVEWVGHDPATNEGVRARYASSKHGAGFAEFNRG